MAFVIDASLAAAWCFSRRAHRLYECGSVGGPLWAYELRNSVLMGVRRKRITKAHAEEFLVSLRTLPIRLVDPPSYDDVFGLADRHGLTVYDAAYLDLAMREKLPLASLDAALIRAAQASGVTGLRR